MRIVACTSLALLISGGPDEHRTSANDTVGATLTLVNPPPGSNYELRLNLDCTTSARLWLDGAEMGGAQGEWRRTGARIRLRASSPPGDVMSFPRGWHRWRRYVFVLAGAQRLLVPASEVNLVCDEGSFDGAVLRWTEGLEPPTRGHRDVCTRN